MPNFSFRSKISRFSFSGIKSLFCLSVALDLFQWMPFQGDRPIWGFTTPEWLFQGQMLPEEVWYLPLLLQHPYAVGVRCYSAYANTRWHIRCSGVCDLLSGVCSKSVWLPYGSHVTCVNSAQKTQIHQAAVLWHQLLMLRKLEFSSPVSQRSVRTAGRAKSSGCQQTAV